MYRNLADAIFFYCMVFMLLVGRVFMGCELDLKVVKNAFRRPIASLIGLACQFLIMPLLGYTFSQLILSNQKSSVLLGLFVMSVVPVMTTFWVKTLGTTLLRDDEKIVMQVPYLNLFLSLGALTLPLIVGILIARHKPKWAAFAKKAMRPTIYVYAASILIFGTILYYPTFVNQLTWNAVFAAILLTFCGFYAGFFFAYILGQRIEDIVAIAIETGVQNMPIAIAVLKISFPHFLNEEYVFMPVLVCISTPFPIIVYYVVRSIAQMFSSPVVATNDEEANLDNSMDSISRDTRIVMNDSSKEDLNFSNANKKLLTNSND